MDAQSLDIQKLDFHLAIFPPQTHVHLSPRNPDITRNQRLKCASNQASRTVQLRLDEHLLQRSHDTLQLLQDQYRLHQKRKSLYVQPRQRKIRIIRKIWAKRHLEIKALVIVLTRKEIMEKNIQIITIITPIRPKRIRPTKTTLILKGTIKIFLRSDLMRLQKDSR